MRRCCFLIHSPYLRITALRTALHRLNLCSETEVATATPPRLVQRCAWYHHQMRYSDETCDACQSPIAEHLCSFSPDRDMDGLSIDGSPPAGTCCWTGSGRLPAAAPPPLPYLGMACVLLQYMAESLAGEDHRELPTENRQAMAYRTDTPRVGTSPPHHLGAEAHLPQLQGSPLQDFCCCARPAQGKP